MIFSFQIDHCTKLEIPEIFERFCVSHHIMPIRLINNVFDEFYPVCFKNNEYIRSFKHFRDITYGGLSKGPNTYVGYLKRTEDSFCFFSNYIPEKYLCCFNSGFFKIKKILFENDNLEVKSFNFVDGKMMGSSKTLRKKNDRYKVISDLKIEFSMSNLEMEMILSEINNASLEKLC